MPFSREMPRMTGRFRWVRPVLFGRKVLQVETVREVFAPVFAGHSPRNWKTVRSWRRADPNDNLSILHTEVRT